MCMSRFVAAAVSTSAALLDARSWWRTGLLVAPAPSLASLAVFFSVVQVAPIALLISVSQVCVRVCARVCWSVYARVCGSVYASVPSPPCQCEDPLMHDLIVADIAFRVGIKFAQTYSE